MDGNKLSLGRNHATADEVTVTYYPYPDDMWKVDIRWNDGAHVWHFFDTFEEAVKQVHSLGFR